MIAFFPAVYPDELVYSWFARYYVRTGYTTYRAVAEDLYTSNTAKPNLEFLMELSEDAYKAVSSGITFETVIMKHTMFPYYARFLPMERRQRALTALFNMDKDFNNALYIRKDKTIHRRWLRYCPLCAKEDRHKYGETYWHRQHQLDHIDICPTHGCKLMDSTVDNTSKSSPSLIHAEEVVPLHTDAIIPGNVLELKVAQYVTSVFEADMAIDNPITIGQFMHSKMERTKYLSTRGNKRFMALLNEDFNRYYKDLPQNTLSEAWQMEKIFSNYRCHTYDICLLAMFLNVPVAELVDMRLPEKSQAQLFDEQIRLLHDQGLNYRQISERLGASYDFCKLVAKRQRMAAQ